MKAYRVASVEDPLLMGQLTHTQKISCQLYVPARLMKKAKDSGKFKKKIP
jgi:hypothetical protein